MAQNTRDSRQTVNYPVTEWRLRITIWGIKKEILRRHPDLNWGVTVLQTAALPLGYAALNNKKYGLPYE
jgi:hypothetical protein